MKLLTLLFLLGLFGMSFTLENSHTDITGVYYWGAEHSTAASDYRIEILEGNIYKDIRTEDVYGIVHYITCGEWRLKEDSLFFTPNKFFTSRDSTFTSSNTQDLKSYGTRQETKIFIVDGIAITNQSAPQVLVYTKY